MNKTTDGLRVVVPARLGSNRVKVKNLRLLGDQPLICYIIKALKETKYLSKHIDINSDSELFSEIADKEGVGFYKRKKHLATSASLIDEYIYDYICSTRCDYLAVVNPTSPFMSSNSLDAAWEQFQASNCDTLLSCERIQTHCFYKTQPINFSTNGLHPRSQDLDPVLALNFAITIWNCSEFVKQYEEVGHGVYTGKLDFFETEGFESIDVDYPDDFIQAEIALQFQNRSVGNQPRYPEYVTKYLKQNPNVEN